jgi:hypothetical protein
MLGMLDKYSKHEKIFDTLRRRKITVAQFHLMLILASRGNEYTEMPDLIKYMQRKSNRRVGQSAVSRAIKNLGEENRYKDEKTGLPRDGHDFLDTKYGKQGEDGKVDERFLLFRLNKRGLDFVDRTLNL